MAGRISELTALTSVATTDLVEVVDVSDTSMAATGTNKKVQLSNLGSSMLIPGTVETTYKSGRYYPLFGGLLDQSGASSSGAVVNISAGHRRYMPVRFVAPTVLDRLIYAVGTASPSFDTRWALYDSDGVNGFPYTRITDFGVHTTGAGAEQLVTITDQPVEAKLYWIGFMQSVDQGGAQWIRAPYASYGVAGITSLSYTGVLLEVGSFGAWPATANGGFNSGWNPPFVGCRIK